MLLHLTTCFQLDSHNRTQGSSMAFDTDSLFRTGYSWWRWLPALAYSTLGGALTLGLLYGAGASGLYFALATLVLTGAYAVITMFHRSLTVDVTSGALFIERKFLSIDNTSVNLPRIESIAVHQTFVQRILGYGNLTVTSGDEDFVLNGIKAPAKLKEALIAAMKTAGEE